MKDFVIRNKTSHLVRRWTMLALVPGVLTLLVLINLVPVGESYAASPSLSGLLAPLNGSIVYLPIVFQKAPPTPTPTFTSTSGPTPTGTQTPTPITLTPTHTPTTTGTPATETPTATGTPPTPTRTGTVTADLGVIVSVSPSEARINERLTFTIRVTNNGSAPTNDAVLSNSFPAYIDVETATTTRGTAVRSAHSVVVTIGTINPGETITITFVVRVNSSLTRTETVGNVAVVTYDTNKSKTGVVNYRVIVTSTLPGTGELPLMDLDVSPPGVGASRYIKLAGLGSLVIGILFIIKRREKINRILARRHSYRKLSTLISASVALALLLVVIASCVPSDSEVPLTTVSLEPSPASLVVEPSLTPSRLPYMPARRFATPEPFLTLPDYPIPTPPMQTTPSEEQAQPDTSPLVRLMIPALGVDAVVKYVPYDGLTWLIAGLREEIAWLGETGWPGLGGNTVLAGHVTVRGLGEGPFRYLEQLGAGESVTLYTEENIYSYRVREQVLVEETDMAVTFPTANSQLTLITCTEWDEELEIYRKRRVIFADLVQVEPLVRRGVIAPP